MLTCHFSITGAIAFPQLSLALVHKERTPTPTELEDSSELECMCMVITLLIPAFAPPTADSSSALAPLQSSSV